VPEAQRGSGVRGDLDAPALDDHDGVSPFALAKEELAARRDGDGPGPKTGREPVVEEREPAVPGFGHHTVRGRPKAGNTAAGKVTMSAILPASIRSTSSASGRYSEAPGARR
jgi:hypothetical protein